VLRPAAVLCERDNGIVRIRDKCDIVSQVTAPRPPSGACNRGIRRYTTYKRPGT
jgi:hypothetical protein